MSAITPLPLFGNPSAPIVCVVDPVVRTKDRDGKPRPVNENFPISGRHLKVLEQHLVGSGLEPKDLLLISCAPPMDEDAWKLDSRLNAHLKEHRATFMQTLAAYKPKLILCMGKAAARQFYGRAIKITNIRGVPKRDDVSGLNVLPMFSPQHVAKLPEVGDLFRADLKTAGSIKGADYTLDYDKGQTEVTYKWCEDLTHLLLTKPKLLALDLEATTRGHGFPHWYNKRTQVTTVQLCVRPGLVYCLPLSYLKYFSEVLKLKGLELGTRMRQTFAKLVDQLRRLLTDPKVKLIGHNLKYDLCVLREVLGIDVPKANYKDDTILLVHAIDENMRQKSLDDCTKRFVPAMAGYNDVLNLDPSHLNKTRMDLMPPDKKLAYACGDADASMRNYLVLRTMLDKDPRAAKAHDQITMPANRGFIEVEREGFSIDIPALTALQQWLEQHLVEEEARLLAKVHPEIKAKWSQIGSKKVNFGRPDFLRDVLFGHPKGLKLKAVTETKTGKVSTSTKKHLSYFATNPFVADLIEFQKNSALLDNPIKPIWRHIVDDFLRPTYQLFGAVTGRTSSRDPNGQNFPKRGKLAKIFRKIFKALKGFVLISCDYSQIELRVAAIMSKCKRMLEIYREGGDIHCATAAAVMGITLEEFLALKMTDPELFDDKRFQAKAINFGFIYGMGWRNFRVYAKTEYKVDFTEAEAKAIRTAFFETYPELVTWHTKVKEFVRQHGYVRSIDGRVRHLINVNSDDDAQIAMSERQAVNAPVQAFAGNLGLLAIGRIVAANENALPKDKLRLCGFIHDAIIGYVPRDRAVILARRLKAFMESNPLEDLFGFKSPIPITADVELGESLADLIKVEPAWLDDPKIVSFEQVKALQDAIDAKRKKAADAKAAQAKHPRIHIPVKRSA